MDNQPSATRNANKRYWIFQLLGWGAYFSLGAALASSGGANRLAILMSHLFYIALGIALTHWFRFEIQRRRPLYSAVTSMWPFLAASALAISLILAASVVGTNILVDPASAGDWTTTATVALWWGMFLAAGVWTVLYIWFSERRVFQAREYQLELSLREAELRVLESQINPHFLFNCLNSIRALVGIDPPRAQDMLTRLANVLRHSLHHDRRHTVPLASEMDAVTDYLALEAVRFEDRMKVDLSIAPETAACPIPPMLLQTLVENAVKHGIGQTAGPGELSVRAERCDGFVRLAVENTGELNNAPAHGPQLGLANTRERLRLLYGDRASLSLKGGNGRVTATVQIPA